MKYLMAALCALALTGCVEEENRMPDMSGTCGADGMQHLVGQPRDAFDDSSIDGTVRILPPGSMMTMDHRPDRLNIELDEDDIITRLWCG